MSFDNMYSRVHLAVLVLVLVVAATTAQQQQQQQRQQQQQQQQNQRSPDDSRRLQLRRQQGDIDAILPNTPLVKLTREDINNFMNNQKSVAILTRCFVKPTECKSASAYNIMNQMNALTIAGGQCKECTPEEDKWLEELMYLLVQGYTSRYPEQWQQIYPSVKVLVVAAARRARS